MRPREIGPLPSEISGSADQEPINEHSANYDQFAPQLMEREPVMYEYFLGIDPTTVKGKTIVNIGSGQAGLFEKEMKKQGAHILTLTPFFGSDTPGGRMFRQRYKHKPMAERVAEALPWRGQKGRLSPIAAQVEGGIPLKDASVDQVTALYSVPLYLENPEISRSTMLTEIYRILRNDGRASLYPIPEKDKEEFTALLKEYDIEAYRFIEVAEQSDVVFHDQKCFRLEIDKPTASDQAKMPAA